MKNRALTVGGTVLSLLLLAGVFYRVQPAVFWAALKETDPVALGSCVFFFGVSCLARAAMWRVTTRPLQPVGFSTLCGGIIVGYLANNLLPARAGEVVRAYYLARCTGIAGPAAFATVCVERVLDAASLGLLVAAALVVGVQGLRPETGRLTLLILCGALTVGAAAFAGLLRLSERAVGTPVFPAPVRDALASFTGPLRPLGQPRMLALLVTLSLLAWGANYLSLLALVPDAAASRPQAALLLLLFINLGLLVPSSPGAFGMMQLAFWAALAPFGLPKEVALALSLAYQGGLYLFTLALGLPYYARAHISLGKIAAEATAQQKEDPTAGEAAAAAVAKAPRSFFRKW